MDNTASFTPHKQVPLSQSFEETSLNDENLSPNVNSVSETNTEIDKMEKISLKIAFLELDGESKYIEFDYDYLLFDNLS